METAKHISEDQVLTEISEKRQESLPLHSSARQGQKTRFSGLKHVYPTLVIVSCVLLAIIRLVGIDGLYPRHVDVGRVHPFEHDLVPALRGAEEAPRIDLPLNPIVWGEVNFIHTTDTHGWLLGHQKFSEPEPNASGTFGDFYSFVSRMKAQARQRGVDLLVVDSGDLHDGNGLSDGFPKGGVNGHETNRIITEVPYDVLSIGNHEMYKYPVVYDVYKNFAPRWSGRFLTSNVNITVVGSDGSLTSVPIGERYSRFTTTQGRKVLALGVLLDFKNNAANTTVQETKELVTERWFREVVREEVDFFLLVGHMAVSDPNWRLLVNAIRAIHPITPIFIFGGHYHIRDCAMFDDRTIAMASGRYMETVGWMGATLPSKHEKNMNFTRRYLDANRVTYQYHTETTPETFDTPQGLNITRDLLALAEKFNLNAVFGTVPHDYYLDRLPWSSENSVVSLFVNKALPAILPPSYPDRAVIPSIIVVQSGGQRFDMFKGPFTRNDQFIVSPFTDNFLYLSVPYGIGSQMLIELRKRGAGTSAKIENEDVVAARDEAESGSGEIEKTWRLWRKTQWQQAQAQISEAAWPSWPPWKQPTLGWVTTDSCPGGPGDDTLHKPIPFYRQPDYVSHSNVPRDTHNATLHDIIFLPFFSKDVIEVVNELRAQARSRGLGFDVPQMRNVTAEDMQPYGAVRTNEVLGIYARAMWSDQPAS